jgi:hypothetical protein
MSEYFNTIDLDKIDKEELEHIKNKIQTFKCCKSVQSKDSSSKGYHLLIVCSKKCDLCRLMFDDQKRYSMDNQRDLKYQNTLFDSKEPLTANLKHLDFCERCKPQKVILQKINLSPEQMISKLEEKKIPKPYVIFGRESEMRKIAFLLGYMYMECPKCKWGKFKKYR